MVPTEREPSSSERLGLAVEEESEMMMWSPLAGMPGAQLVAVDQLVLVVEFQVEVDCAASGRVIGTTMVQMPRRWISPSLEENGWVTGLMGWVGFDGAATRRSSDPAGKMLSVREALLPRPTRQEIF